MDRPRVFVYRDEQHSQPPFFSSAYTAISGREPTSDEEDEAAVSEEEDVLDMLPPAQPVIEVPGRPPDAIHVAFFKHADRNFFDNPWQWVVSKWIARRSPVYEHCQLVFSWYRDDGPPISATFSTSMTVPSSYVRPAYSAEKWSALPIVSCTEAGQRAAMWRWCQEHENAPFNKCGYYCNHLPMMCSCFAYDAAGEAFYCAEQVIHAMQSVELPEAADVVPYLSVPDDIYDMLLETGAKPTLLYRPTSNLYRTINRPPVRRMTMRQDDQQQQPSRRRRRSEGSGTGCCCCCCCCSKRFARRYGLILLKECCSTSH